MMIEYPLLLVSIENYLGSLVSFVQFDPAIAVYNKIIVPIIITLITKPFNGKDRSFLDFTDAAQIQLPATRLSLLPETVIS